ncbi:MAG: TRAP transporter large permease subunit [Alphaproteobacteria bacterium]|jgi:tripartite ATP-independent transporter DctM subunit|nr:TRAP transporter large permease subunit [Alphaproteobacteria bacterium]MBT5919933.1 TRAP transporter large permease subunit [Alphaproteobacteria bacterium]MBT6386736.1 TRAP transporter large permease subunit [Alphaproteobacteria bacterium]
MEWYWTLALLLGSILFLMFIGLPVGLAFILVNTVAAVVLFGRFGDLDINMLEGIHQLTDNAFANITIFAIVPIPMFLLMGEMFFHTGLANKMFNAVEQLMGRVPARLSYVTVAGGTVFATLSGSSMGSTALLGTLMIPEMSERGYKKKMSIGPILGTGGLAMLIPPSALAVLLGTLAELDIGRLLIAGIIPGLILASFYIVLIFVQATLDKDAAPAYDVVQVPLAKRLALVMTDVVPMISVIVMVILLIMFGIATPSESAAYGSLGVILLSIIYLFIVPLLRGDVAAAKAFWPQFGRALWRSMWGAGRVTVIAIFILFGSSLFSNVLAASQASVSLIEWVTSFDVSGYALLVIMFGVLLLLGMFMDQFAMMLLTVPIFFPIVQGIDFGMPMNMQMIWFAVIMLLAMEISFTTPPFGLLLFVMQGVAPPGTRFSEICMAALPFMMCAMLLVALIVIFPSIALWLPFLGGG